MDSNKVKSIIDMYVSSWNEVEPMALREKLDRCWDVSGTYTDPNIQAQGRGPLLEYMLKFHDNVPGARFVLTDSVATHHDQLHIRWQLVDRDNKPMQMGNSFGELSQDGKLARMTGFFSA